MKKISVDTREKKPFTQCAAWKDVEYETVTLKTADYEYNGITIERKGAGDFINCCGKDKARFYRELKRGFDYLVIEADLQGLKTQLRRSRSKMKIQYIIHVLKEIRKEYGCEVILCKDREAAATVSLHLLTA